MTVEKAREAVKKANEILRKAGIKLIIVQVNDPPGADNGDQGSDGDFTEAEFLDMRRYGAREILKLGNRKGAKISFAHDCWVEDEPVVGWAVHRSPIICIEDIGAEATGLTIAHEIGHLMTLEDHSPDPDNLMHESSGGTDLTPAQIREMKSRRYVHAKCATQLRALIAARKDRQGFGRAADLYGDQSTSSRLYDLQEVVLTTLDTDAHLEAQISVGDVLPAAGNIDAVYALGFDRDANASTGVWFEGQYGVDRIVRVRASGDKSLGTFSLTGEIENTATSTTTPLPQQPVEAPDAQFDGSVTSYVATSFLFRIPRSGLGLAVAEVPVMAAAGDSSNTYDTEPFEFDSLRWQKDPTLETFGTGVPVPGQPYPVALSGLEPSSPFALYVDDDLVLSGTLDGTGAFSGSFVFPTDKSEVETHFLTAQDSTGEFAYNITCPAFAIPALPPIGLALLTLGLVFSGIVALDQWLAKA